MLERGVATLASIRDESRRSRTWQPDGLDCCDGKPAYRPSGGHFDLSVDVRNSDSKRRPYSLNAWIAEKLSKPTYAFFDLPVCQIAAGKPDVTLSAIVDIKRAHRRP